MSSTSFAPGTSSLIESSPQLSTTGKTSSWPTKPSVASPSRNIPNSESLPAHGVEEWFDDVDLEDSTEFEHLRRHVSELTIKIPSRMDGDTHLASLVDSVNRPSNVREDQVRNLGLLEDYIQRLARDKDDKEREISEVKDRVEKGWKERQERRTRVFRKVHRLTKTISSSMKNAFVLVLRVLKGGMKVLDSLSFFASEVTFQTHYQVAVKAIIFFITAYDSADELTGEIQQVFDRLDSYGREMKALQENIRSVPMSKAINKLFVSIVAFIVNAGSYLKHGMLSKMVLYVGGKNEKFQGLLRAIRDSYDEVKQVMEFAQVMINLKTLEKTGKLGEDTTIIIQQLRLLNSSMPPEMPTQLRDVHDHTRFHAELHIQTLRAELFVSLYEPSEEMSFNDKERIFLSSRDRWQRQFKPLRPSSDSRSKVALSKTVSTALIWITGHVSRRNVSWVSSLSVDLIPYYRDFSSFNIAYIFCKRGQGPRYTPTLLIKGFIAQLLDAHPTIAMRNLRRLSLDRFLKIGKETDEHSGALAWKLLDDILRLMEEAPELRNRAVLLLIDRLDLCVSEPGFSVLHGLIPRLQNLSHQRSRVQVIITTARLSALAVPTLKRGPAWLQAYGKKTHG